MGEGDKRAPVDYGGYLQLDRLLDCQKPLAKSVGRPAHDEMLFIVVHQAYELWFKQILYELDELERLFGEDPVDDRSMGPADRLLGRIHEILRVAVQHLDILETMTPLDFLEFRDVLYPASGFQSVQFRMIETRLGLKRGDRMTYDSQPYDARLTDDDRHRMHAIDQKPSLSDLIERWLERTPFMETGGWTFTEAFRSAVNEALDRDIAYLRDDSSLDADHRDREAGRLTAAKGRFDALFDVDAHGAAQADGQWRWSMRALQAALFINLYRDEPVLHLPFRCLSRLMDLDEALTNWRYRHALMVQRMIGLKIGTGGSSGSDYLKMTAEKHRIFKDLFALSTFLVPRSSLPALPESLRASMGFHYSPDSRRKG